MNPEIKKKWLDALRSGEYTQGRNYLCKIRPGEEYESFCCLGVLVDLYLHETKQYWTEKMIAGPFTTFSIEGDSNHASLPTDVQRWAGIKTDSPFVKMNGEPRALININDRNKFGFKKIADLIEADPNI